MVLIKVWALASQHYRMNLFTGLWQSLSYEMFGCAHPIKRRSARSVDRKDRNINIVDTKDRNINIVDRNELTINIVDRKDRNINIVDELLI